MKNLHESWSEKAESRIKVQEFICLEEDDRFFEMYMKGASDFQERSVQELKAMYDYCNDSTEKGSYQYAIHLIKNLKAK